jgi:hypothetical protein
VWTVFGPDDESEPDVASLRQRRALAIAAVLTFALALAAVPAMVPVTLQFLRFEELTSVLAGLAAIVCGLKFLAMAGGVTARLVARPPGLVAHTASD